MKYLALLFSLFFALPAVAEAPSINEARVREILPALEAYTEKARQDWKVPVAAVAVIHGDEILWWKGFGKETPDLKTVFAIGSTTKAFAATTLAIMVDEGGPAWDARVADHFPQFAMYDSWVTREMRVADLLAQHTGLAPQALSSLGALGYPRERIWQALRWVKPVTSFRSSYAYVNTPHLIAGELVAQWAGKDEWEDVLQERILQPLGMTQTTWTAEAFKRNPNRADGHATVNGQIKEIEPGPFPYVFGPAGALNSNLHDMARWVRLQLGQGEFEGRRIVSSENLMVTRTPQTVISGSAFYCMGWLKLLMDGYDVTWHNGGTPGHTTFVGLDQKNQLGIVILSNLGGTTFPDAVGLRFFDLVHGVDGPDYSAARLAQRKDPVSKPVVKAAAIPEMIGRYHHPALGYLRVEAGPFVTLEEPGVRAKLEPVGPNLFRIRVVDGWLKDIGWDDAGEALFHPAGLSEPAGLDLYLGDEGEGSRFEAVKVGES
jgi:CubicO group peptidase (beta-lactamase class C family)